MERRSRENGRDYMVPKTYHLTTDNWRERAVEVMRWEVELYDNYVQNEVYNYELYEYDDENGEWGDPCDSCGGFFGSDIMKNGMLEEVGYGLEEVIKAGNYTLGEAELRRTVFVDLGVPA